MQEIKSDDIENFIEYFYDDESGGQGVSLKAFERAFSKLEK